jgi:hypothetical protein
VPGCFELGMNIMDPKSCNISKLAEQLLDPYEPFP